MLSERKIESCRRFMVGALLALVLLLSSVSAQQSQTVTVRPEPVVASGPWWEKPQLENWLDGELQQINLEKQGLQAEKSKLEGDIRLQQMANGTVGLAPSKARPWLAASNTLKTLQLNSRISDWNKRAQQLQQRIDHYNAEVQRYNSMR